jgi:hypothetical protein
MSLKPKTILLVAVVSVGLVLILVEIYLRALGYGHPVLYEYDPVVGYVIKPAQTLIRSGRCRLTINNLGMRSDNNVVEKRKDVFRVLVLGDSVPYGGSYIDQEETFCNVAQRLLNQNVTKFEVLNAGVNAYGPQNVAGYIKSRGLLDADLVIVYFPWGNLRRDFSNFYIVPFWSNDPVLALGEFLRQLTWAIFGRLSQKWKDTNAFQNERVLAMNLAALEEIKRSCDDSGKPVFFFWSPYLDIMTKKMPDKFRSDREELEKRIPGECTIDMEPILKKHGNVSALYVDGIHYSAAGHQVAGKYLAEFILPHANK